MYKWLGKNPASLSMNFLVPKGVRFAGATLKVALYIAYIGSIFLIVSHGHSLPRHGVLQGLAFVDPIEYTALERPIASRASSLKAASPMGELHRLSMWLTSAPTSRVVFSQATVLTWGSQGGIKQINADLQPYGLILDPSNIQVRLAGAIQKMGAPVRA